MATLRHLGSEKHWIIGMRIQFSNRFAIPLWMSLRRRPPTRSHMQLLAETRVRPILLPMAGDVARRARPAAEIGIRGPPLDCESAAAQCYSYILMDYSPLPQDHTHPNKIRDHITNCGMDVDRLQL